MKTHQGEGVQHLLNPPILAPYPFVKTAKHVQDQHNMLAYFDKMIDINFYHPYLISRVFKNVPEREDPNQIDHFMQYAEADKILDLMYSKVLKKMVILC